MLEPPVKVSSSGSENNGGVRFPEIQHPLTQQSKMNAAAAIINSSGAHVSQEDGRRPVPFEEGSDYKMVRSSYSRNSRCGGGLSSPQDIGGDVFMTSIPQNVQTAEGDSNITRLPVFGNKSTLQSRASTASRSNSVASSALAINISPEEVSERFHKKLQTSYYEVRKRFIDNDPEQKGNVTREALIRILQSTTGQHITRHTLSSLLQLWGLKGDKQIFTFTEINSIFFNKTKNQSAVSFMDPVSRQKSKSLEMIKMKSGEVYKWMKTKLENRDIYLTDMFPSAVNLQEFSISQTDLQRALNKMMIDLTAEEMDKLWNRLSPQKKTSLSGMKMLKQLGIIHPPKNSNTKDTKLIEINSPSSLESVLREMLREGYKSMTQEFQKYDKTGKGYISAEDFLLVLSKFNLNLEKQQLNDFLARCIITNTKDGIHYQDFLVRFQDRSEAGITHRLLVKDSKSKNKDDGPIQLIEKKLVNIFQKDFLEILNKFKKQDKNQSGEISIDEFKETIESKLETKFNDDQFNTIVENLPLTSNNKVPYLDFLKQFDTGYLTPLPSNVTPTCNQSENVAEQSQIKQDDQTSSMNSQEIKKMIKSVFDNRFHELESAFEKLDDSNTNQLNQEMMYQLFKLLNVRPEISRGDIRSIWSSFILNDRKTLDYKEFLRHFMYNKLDASFPNAKMVPPVKGDSDLIKRSRKLNGAHDIVLDGLRCKIDIMKTDLMKEFTAFDTNSTGEIGINDFKEILKELSIHLTDTEIEKICEKFSKNMNRINYAAFLYPYGTSHFADENNKRSKKKNSKKLAENKSLFEKLDIMKKPSVRRSVKKADSISSGQIDVNELKSILQAEGVTLSEDDCFQLMNMYDKSLTGSVDYNEILKEY